MFKAADLTLMCTNAMDYNGENSTYFKYFELKIVFILFYVVFYSFTLPFSIQPIQDGEANAVSCPEINPEELISRTASMFRSYVC